ncbi:tetratricopeptide (TPR) repeat protein [Methanolinea mesophila]|uniref:tetratricopeptide repeat protein n=1 Tax=Methanolinea mesophila TaxID=547055 RepID=UPI001AE947C7|nr:tetratricopeptide repeat protein [Methanolinea mesophila]MBP1928615.1 tetratricopeptide (TPR) repeat protein [Methanolinea mesophila]
MVVLLAGTMVMPVAATTQMEESVTLVQTGNDLLVQGRYGDALIAFDSAIEKDPYSSLAWNGRGMALLKMGAVKGAPEAFKKAVEIDPYYVTAWDNLGDSYTYLGSCNDAIDAYDRAIAINPNDLYAMVHKGMCLQELGKPDEAMQLYGDVVRLADYEVRKHPNDARYDARIWANKGDALYRLGRYQEAMDAYSVALQINPKMEQALSGRKAVETVFKVPSQTPGGVPPPLESLTPTPSPTPSAPVSCLPVCGALGILLLIYCRRTGKYR